MDREESKFLMSKIPSTQFGPLDWIPQEQLMISI